MDNLPTYKLGDILSYEQPTNYIVESTEYDDSYPTPVLTAGKSFILGYTNETKGVYDKLPVIIFDDFTTASQFVDFKFKVKSSAMKILSCNEEIADIKYMYYLMQITHIQSDTHKRYWISDYSKVPVSLPPLAIQHAIVARIEALFAELDKAAEHLRTAQQQIKTYRQAVLNHWLNNDDGKWEMVKLKDCTKKIFAGGDVPKNNFSEIKTEKYRIPIYANAVKQKGLYGYTDVSRVNEPCVTIAGRGSGTGHTEIREEPFFPIVRLIVIIPSDNLNNSFLKYMVDSKTMAITGSAIPQLTVPTVEEYEFSLPPLAEQQRIVQEIESRLSRATASETYIENALQQAEALRQSILKKAFSGEFVSTSSTTTFLPNSATTFLPDSTTNEAVPEPVEGTVAEAMKGTTVASTGSATKLRNKDL